MGLCFRRVGVKSNEECIGRRQCDVSFVRTIKLSHWYESASTCVTIANCSSEGVVFRRRPRGATNVVSDKVSAKKAKD